MNIIKPKKLKQGDTIGIVSVSGAINEPESIERARIFLENLGYNVVISDSVHQKFRYMSGTDEQRAKALNDFFKDKSIDAIFNARGGYGAVRILDKIDYDAIKETPKIFVGYSDITALLALIYKKTGLITFHGAMMKGDFGKETISEYTKNSFFNTLCGNLKEIKAQTPTIYQSGTSKGTLWGGNLSTLVSLCPLDFAPDEDIILFLEDLNEPVYKLDKMFTQLLNIPKLKQNIKGVALGEFSDNCNEIFMNELLKEISDELKVPFCNGFKISHEADKDTIPFGAEVCFDSGNGILRVADNYLE